jgi:hypothetical protein
VETRNPEAPQRKCAIAEIPTYLKAPRPQPVFVVPVAGLPSF